MKMHKLSLIAALVVGGLIACALSSSAEDTNPPPKPPRRPPGAQQRVDRMAVELQLTDDQKTKLTALFEDEAKKMRELRSDTNLTKEERGEKLRAMRKENEAKLKQILTPEQLEKWQHRMHPPTHADGEKKPDGNKADKAE